MSPPPPAAPETFLAAQAAQRVGRLADAAVGYRATLLAHPDARPAYHNLATVLTQLQRWSEAEQVLRDGLARWPDDPRLKVNLGHLRLAVGDFAEGWSLYESRRQAEENGVRSPAFSFPEWRGEAVRSLLLFPEQGFGDQIQFARYAPELKRRGIAVTLACAPALVRLFEPLGVQLAPAAGDVRFAPHDAWALVGSLPLRFGTTLQSIPPPAPIAGRPRPSGGRTGVATRCNPTPYPNRSLPPALAARLLAHPGVISLHPEDSGARDFQDTADLIAGLERVITVDTSVAHVAGSLGKPTWLLVPSRSDWRWMRERQDSPWYPSIRIYRQPATEDWSPAVDAVLADLAACETGAA